MSCGLAVLPVVRPTAHFLLPTATYQIIIKKKILILRDSVTYIELP